MCKTPASILHLARCVFARQLNRPAAHSPADVLRAIKAAKKTMQAALTQLSADLYTQECRWLLELLQNADDNEYLLRSIFMSTWGFLPVVFRPFRTVFPGLGAGFLNLGGKMGRTAKKRGKNEQKWARNGLKRVGAS